MPKWTVSISTLKFDIATMKQVPKKGLPTYSKLSEVTDSKKSYFEQFFLRFPQLTQHILRNLDDQNLIKFDELNKELCENDTKERLVWIRIIRKNASRFITAVELDCF